MKPRLVAPYCTVILDDGAVLEVQSNNWDMLNYERYAVAHKWPAADVAPLEAATYIAWHALHREAQIPDGLDYERFTRQAVSIETKRLTPVDPTPPAAEEG